MFPGPTLIRQCAVCAKPFEQETLASGNTFGAKFWTDGKMEAPMLPDQHSLIQCPHCRALLWIDEQQILGEVDWGERNQFPDACAYIVPTFEDYLLALKSLDLEPEKERYLRLWAWWTGNHPRRKSTKPLPLTKPEAENLRRLAALADEADEEDRLMKAEILRELGQFAEALVLLHHPFCTSHTQAVAIIKISSEQGDPFVKEIHFD